MDRSLPNELLPGQIEKAAKGVDKLVVSDYVGAADAFVEQYDQLLDAQIEYGRTLHKGAALYNVGLARTYNGDYDLGIWHFSLAYVEDLLSTELGSERDAESGLAAQVVEGLFQMDEQIALNVKQYTMKLKREVVEDKSRWKRIADPEDILVSVLNKLGLARDRLLSRCRQKQPKLRILEIPQPWSRRVFIGGNYDLPGNLFVIAEIVRARGYIPKLACEIAMMPDLEEKNTHESSLMLLHTCKYAIFDVSTYSGWLMELERTRDYGIRKVLLVRNTMDPLSVNRKISKMIKGMGKTVKPFKKIGQLVPLIEKFLPEPPSS